jgi:hypothetical protein
MIVPTKVKIRVPGRARTTFPHAASIERGHPQTIFGFPRPAPRKRFFCAQNSGPTVAFEGTSLTEAMQLPKEAWAYRELAVRHTGKSNGRLTAGCEYVGQWRMKSALYSRVYGRAAAEEKIDLYLAQWKQNPGPFPDQGFVQTHTQHDERPVEGECGADLTSE